ncbi:unnamed protein product, partial [Ectocarpus sp. 4 AP-2014]
RDVPVEQQHGGECQRVVDGFRARREANAAVATPVLLGSTGSGLARIPSQGKLPRMPPDLLLICRARPELCHL